MAKKIVIVESPTKVKTINKILGRKYKVLSSMGHLIDLPKSTLGVDLENNFQPKMIVVRSKQKLLTKLKKDTKDAEEIYFATDPDREGEAIGWNLTDHIGVGKKIFRVSFQEITKDAVLKAFENVREFDKQKIEAQVGRRLLDRIVGYKISPLLWKKVGSRLSAGRVQSVALKIIVERERAIEAFVPKEYWHIKADLNKKGLEQNLTAQLDKIDGKKAEIPNESEAQKLAEEIKSQPFTVTSIVEKETKRKAGPPLITSTMQQEAFNKLKFNSAKTMMLAQQLYEGITVGSGDSVGLITYMRTDSVNVSKDAIQKVRDHISTVHGAKYLPDQPNQYRSKKSAQEAHEAIRPTDLELAPAKVKPYLQDDQFKLYELIWNRFVSSQMVPAIYLSKKIEIQNGRCLFSASGSNLIFDGYLTMDKDAREEDKLVDFSAYAKDDMLDLVKLHPSQHFTKPPPRFSDASLVKALEENGIGRPSTYASIIQTLVGRNYVLRERGYLSPTELGCLINDLLVEYFSKIINENFTARMEERLDEVEEGKLGYPELLAEFYESFKEELEYAESHMTKAEHLADRECPECGNPLLVKWGRNGRFLSCSHFPDCKHAEAYPIGIQCAKGLGDVVERRSRRGGTFYGCSLYPKCKLILNKIPVQSDDVECQHEDEQPGEDKPANDDQISKEES